MFEDYLGNREKKYDKKKRQSEREKTKIDQPLQYSFIKNLPDVVVGEFLGGSHTSLITCFSGEKCVGVVPYYKGNNWTSDCHPLLYNLRGFAIRCKDIDHKTQSVKGSLGFHRVSEGEKKIAGKDYELAVHDDNESTDARIMYGHGEKFDHNGTVFVLDERDSKSATEMMLWFVTRRYTSERIMQYTTGGNHFKDYRYPTLSRDECTLGVQPDSPYDGLPGCFDSRQALPSPEIKAFSRLEPYTDSTIEDILGVTSVKNEKALLCKKV